MDALCRHPISNDLGITGESPTFAGIPQGDRTSKSVKSAKAMRPIQPI
jgi:hypothetical protein